MGRLTERVKQGIAFVTINKLTESFSIGENPYDYTVSISCDAINKLAEYEDLEEQCIKETTWGLKELLHKWKAFYNDIVELSNYRQLEKQGLLLRLPCKDGDKLYDIRQDNVKDRRNDKVHELSVSGVSVKIVPWETWMASDILLEEIGKTVFLTEKEAEEALKKMLST